MSNPSFRKVLRYLWDSEPANSDLDNNIVVLGLEHDPRGPVNLKSDGSNSNSTTSLTADENNDTDGSHNAHQNPWPGSFLSDVESKVWLTYRTGFALIPKAKQGPSTISIGGILRGSGIDLTGFTSDVGWGCMIRTGQSLLANALMMLELGRNWRRTPGDSCEAEKRIALLFLDHPDAPFSIHRFVQHGEAACGKMPGEWFGPSAAASSIKYLCDQRNCSLRVYIASGSDVYENKLLNVAKGPERNGPFHPTLVLLGVRLGIDKVNKIYYDPIRSFFDCPQAVGIAGGRPSASHYFYGYQGDNLFYLDPHQPRTLLATGSKHELTEASIETLHTKRIRILNLEEMDPSMLVGFLIKSEEDLKDWKSRMTQTTHKYNIINFFASEPQLIRRSSITMANEDEFIDVGLEEGLDCPSDRVDSAATDDDISFSPKNSQKPASSIKSGPASSHDLRSDESICGSYVSVEADLAARPGFSSTGRGVNSGSYGTNESSYGSRYSNGYEGSDIPAAVAAHNADLPRHLTNHDVEDEPVMVGSYISSADGEEWEEMMGSLRGVNMKNVRSVSYSNGHGKPSLGRRQNSNHLDDTRESRDSNSYDEDEEEDTISQEYDDSHDEIGIGAGNIEM